MLRFDVVFPDLARAECRRIENFSNPHLPKGTFLFLEAYCTERGCDCRRALLQVWSVEERAQIATINYGFEPEPPPFEDQPRIFLDPINPQSRASEGFLAFFEEMIEDDPAYHDRLVRHYVMWKAVVDDPAHPLHAKVRNETHDDPSFSPAYPKRQEPLRRAGPKVGPNDPCPCGSGKKHKRCCRK